MTVGNCYNTGYVAGGTTGHAMIGGLFGYDYVSASNNYQYSNAGTEQFATAMSAEDFKYGVVANKLDDAYWGQNIGVDAVPVFTKHKYTPIYHERKMANVWGTAILPFTVSVHHISNCEVYTISNIDIDPEGSTGTITLKSIETIDFKMIDPNTPFFIKRTCEPDEFILIQAPLLTNAITLPSETKPTTTVGNGWSLVGTYDEQTDLTDVFFLAQDMIWYAEAPIIVPAFRAYLTHNGVNNARSFSINIDEDGETTQIGVIRDGEFNMFDGKYLEDGRIVICR